MPEHEATAISIADILDQLYMTNREQLTIRIGIWDADATPFTYYAELCDADGSPLLGASTYGSDTLGEAIVSLYEEVCAADLGKLSER